MHNMKMKAKAGVTLVELLVVILIVTILSVSMLPLLQPFVTEAQYAAEAIPVIGNLRTKIGLYQYDKGSLPGSSGTNDWVLTWKAGVTVSESTGSEGGDSEKFGPAYYVLNSGAATAVAMSDVNGHIGKLVDIDYQDLKGKRSKPPHYQYYVISSEVNPSYVIGCFGDGNGLKAGTGYAVCELNFTKAQKKYIGTWKRYKPADDTNGAISYSSEASLQAAEKPVDCYIPSAQDFNTTWIPAEGATGEPEIVQNMRKAGWEF